jgi:hypothetical protein
MKPNLTGVALAAGAGCIFVAWALMPEAATNDAGHILTAVTNARPRVHASALWQLLGSALLVPGLVAEAQARRTTTLGVIVTLWGVLGMAADAVFHQLAYEMTAPGLAREALLPVMERMQTAELAPHLPLLFAFIVGPVLLGWQLRRAGEPPFFVYPLFPSALLMAPAATIPVGLLAARLVGMPKRAIALTVFGEICLGLIGLGLAGLARRRRHAER